MIRRVGFGFRFKHFFLEGQIQTEAYSGLGEKGEGVCPALRFSKEERRRKKEEKGKECGEREGEIGFSTLLYF